MIVPGPASQATEASAPSNQSARSIANGEAPMGVATTRSMERVAAALGDPARNERRVEIHCQANPIPSATLEIVGTELNATEICYPGPTLRLVYRPIRSSIFPPGQEV